ncbi:MAG: hypothetical protein ABIA47_03775 [bacterium]
MAKKKAAKKSAEPEMTFQELAGMPGVGFAAAVVICEERLGDDFLKAISYDEWRAIKVHHHASDELKKRAAEAMASRAETLEQFIEVLLMDGVSDEEKKRIESRLIGLVSAIKQWDDLEALRRRFSRDHAVYLAVVNRMMKLAKSLDRLMYVFTVAPQGSAAQKNARLVIQKKVDI